MDGFQIVRDGYIQIKKGNGEIEWKFLKPPDPLEISSKILDNDEVRKIKNPELNPLAAFKKTVAKREKNVIFSKQPLRNKHRYQST